MNKQHFKIQFYFSNAYNSIFDIGFEEQDSQIIFDLLYVFGAKFDTQKQIINLDYKIQYNKQFQVKKKKDNPIWAILFLLLFTTKS